MIDPFFIESAKRIREEFLNLNQRLAKHEGELRQIIQLMMDTSKELERYRDKDIDKETDVNKVKDFIVSKLDYLDDESNKLAKKINPINESIEKIQKEEQELYKAIRSRYPDLSDQQIIQEIHKHLVK